jgi:hypothetical protein
MPDDQSNPPTNSSATPQTTGPQRSWARPLAMTVAALFVISSAFPTIAGLSKNSALSDVKGARFFLI